MANSPDREDLIIAGPAGRLEAMLETPREPAHGRIGILCHPHPQHHGTMLNKVVHTLARAMNDLGIPALRFNFRGVGGSEGGYGEGDGELDDLLAVCEFARARWPHAELWLAGFSFGAVIAARGAEQVGAARLVTIAPAVNILGQHLDAPPSMPWLIVQGDADEIVPVAGVRKWVAAHQPGPVLHEMPGVDHFFHGQLVALRRLLTEQLAVDGV